MNYSKSLLAKAALAAVLAGGTLAAAATTASADVVCNRYGECWHVRDHYNNYPTTLGVIFHDTAWEARHHHDYRWRHDRRDDHGYWRNGRWHTF